MAVGDPDARVVDPLFNTKLVNAPESFSVPVTLNDCEIDEPISLVPVIDAESESVGIVYVGA